MLLFKEYDDYLNYLQICLICENSCTVIASDETANDIIAILHNYIEEDVNNYITITNNEEDTYIISKTKHNDGDVELIIEPLHRDKDIKDIADELVIVEQFTMEDKDITEHIEAKELKIVGLEYNQKEEDQRDCYNCEDFDCEHNCNCDDEDSIIDEIEEYIDEEIETYKHDKDMTLNNLCFKIYCTAFESGQKEALLGLRESIDEALGE